MLEKYPRFRSVSDTAEEMTLVGTSIDFLTAGQAFHWFDSEKARGEFQRLLKLSGWVVLVWNERQGVTYPLGNDYALLSSSYYREAGQPGHELILSEQGSGACFSFLYSASRKSRKNEA